MTIAIATTLVAFCILQTVAAPPPFPPPPYKEAQQLSKPTGFAAKDQNHMEWPRSYRQHQQRLFEEAQLQQLFQAYEKIAQQQLRAYENAQPLAPPEWASWDNDQPQKQNYWSRLPPPG